MNGQGGIESFLLARSEESLIPACFEPERFLPEQIHSGSLRPREAIPPESQLRQRVTTNRLTVRQLPSRLVYEGLIGRQWGRGSYVKSIYRDDCFGMVVESRGRPDRNACGLMTLHRPSSVAPDGDCLPSAPPEHPSPVSGQG
jgi:DNA-binding transcriptional MocR family regulator